MMKVDYEIREVLEVSESVSLRNRVSSDIDIIRLRARSYDFVNQAFFRDVSQSIAHSLVDA